MPTPVMPDTMSGVTPSQPIHCAYVPPSVPAAMSIHPLGRQLDHAKIGFDRWHHTIVGCQDGGFMPISILTSTTPRATSMPTIPVIINRYCNCLLPSVAACFNFNGGFLQHETRFPSAQSTALLLLHSWHISWASWLSHTGADLIFLRYLGRTHGPLTLRLLPGDSTKVC